MRIDWDCLLVRVSVAGVRVKDARAQLDVQGALVARFGEALPRLRIMASHPATGQPFRCLFIFSVGRAVSQETWHWFITVLTMPR